MMLIDRICVDAAYWMVAFRNIDHANQDTNAAIEGYHGALKSRMGQHKSRLLGRRLDWLVDILMGEVLEHYKMLAYRKAHGLQLNCRQEELTVNAVLQVGPPPPGRPPLTTSTLSMLVGLKHIATGFIAVE